MKILKYGEGYSKIITCNLCKSELEYENKDKLNCLECCNDFTKKTTYIICPVCGNSNVIDKHITYHNLRNGVAKDELSTL